MGWYKHELHKDLWRPDKWSYEKKKDILARIDKARELLEILKRNIVNNSLDTHETYNRIFDIAEGLYGDMEIGKLIQDYNRRKAAVAKLLDKRGLRK